MADFRKLLLALIAGALIFGTVASAADFSCQVSGVPTLIRSEGVADFVGDVLMSCSGTLPPLDVTNGLTANIRLSFLGQNVIITSKVLDPSHTPSPVSEATLIKNNAVWTDGTRHPKGYQSVSTAALVPWQDGSQNIYQALQLNSQELEWQGVMLVGPGSANPDGTATVSIRMTNVRINAQALGVNGAINAQVNITTPSSIPIFGNTSVLVANIRQGLIISHSGETFNNCDLQPDGTVTFTTTLTEGFGTAFKPRVNGFAGAAGPPVVPPATGHFVPGAGYFDESGYNPVGFTLGFAGQINGGVLDVGSVLVGQSLIGLATQGTRFSITVTSVPAGVTLAFGTITTTNGLVVSPVSVTGNGTGTVVLTLQVDGYSGNGDAQFLVDTITVPIVGSYGAPPVVGTASAHARFVPNATVFVAATETVAPLPRFVDSPGNDADVITIAQTCKSLLLFPYVTTAAGYNTGIAITNTSDDPFGDAVAVGQVQVPTTAYPVTKPQAGACTLYFYGQSNLTALTAAQHAQTTVEIPSGGQFITNLAIGAKGSVYDETGAKTNACDTTVTGNTCPDMPAYVGYMIAACNFQWAHGFSFVTDTGSDRTMGYLALVIPDRGSNGRLPQDNSLGNAPNQGEQLGN